MSDSDLYELKETETPPLDGASGDKRCFQLQFLGKTPNKNFPFTVANETVGCFIAKILGFHSPEIIPHRIEGVDTALVVWMKSIKQSRPSTNVVRLTKLLEEGTQIHGLIVLDLFLANTDRAISPLRNLSFTEEGKLIPFDFGNCLYYRNRPRRGIIAGIPRLTALELNFDSMFDKLDDSDPVRYFEYLTDSNEVKNWCEKIASIPRFIFESAVDSIPNSMDPPSAIERKRLVDFLDSRKSCMLELIKSSHRFPNLSGL